MSQESSPRRPRQPAHTESKSRPRRRRRRRMNPFLYLSLVIAVSAMLAGIAWIWAGDVLALNKAPASAVITVERDASLNDVARTLKENGLIEYKTLFKIFCSFTKAEQKITSGTYELNTDMDYNALVNSMSSRSGSRMTVSITIPEGCGSDFCPSGRKGCFYGRNAAKRGSQSRLQVFFSERRFTAG